MSSPPPIFLIVIRGWSREGVVVGGPLEPLVPLLHHETAHSHNERDEENNRCNESLGLAILEIRILLLIQPLLTHGEEKDRRHARWDPVKEMKKLFYIKEITS
jgi:hypothetical protein